MDVSMKTYSVLKQNEEPKQSQWTTVRKKGDSVEYQKTDLAIGIRNQRKNGDTTTALLSFVKAEI